MSGKALDRPVIRVEFTFADGSVRSRDWTIAELPLTNVLDYPPPWLRNARKRWDHPLGEEEEAERVLSGGYDGVFVKHRSVGLTWIGPPGTCWPS